MNMCREPRAFCPVTYVVHGCICLHMTAFSLVAHGFVEHFGFDLCRARCFVLLILVLVCGILDLVHGSRFGLVRVFFVFDIDLICFNLFDLFWFLT